MIDINEKTFLMYAIKCYNSPNLVMSEFEEDLKRLKYIKRLVKKYKNNGILKERLILNHIIVLSNVFGVEATVRMLFYRMSPDEYPILKTFLNYLNYMPKIVYSINGEDIISSDITIDLVASRKLMDI